MVFEKRKIQLETLGEYLSEVRQSLSMSVEEVSEKTGVKIVNLENLENGKYQLLPPDVYVLGFIRQLANLYTLETEALITQYKKEKNIYLQLSKKQNNPQRLKGKILEKLVLTPKSLSILTGVLLFGFSMVYIVWQVFSINKTPSLEVSVPKENQVVLDSFVKVAGKTDPGMSVAVNGESLFVNKDGKFETQVNVISGPQEVRISVKNRFDKSVTKNIPIIGNVENNFQKKGPGVKLKLDFSGPVELTFLADEGQPETINFLPGETKEISANNKITISVSDGGAVNLTLNGKAMGVLSRQHEKISNLSFFPENNQPATEQK